MAEGSLEIFVNPTEGSRFRSGYCKTQKETKLRIALDVDGVVADFVSAVLAIVSSTDKSLAYEYDWFETAYSPEKAKQVREALNNSSYFWQTILLVKDASKGVRWLRDQDHKIIWVTAPYERKYGWESDRRIWLNKYMNAGSFHEPIIFTVEKKIH